jgi:hypothetical protein
MVNEFRQGATQILGIVGQRRRAQEVAPSAATMPTNAAYLIDGDCQGGSGDLRHDGQAVADGFASTSAAMRRSAS